MKPKEVLGLLITAVSLVVIVAAFALHGGRVEDVNVATAVTLMGFVLILIGPWLWLGEVPIAVRKFIEVRTGKKLEGEGK